MSTTHKLKPLAPFNETPSIRGFARKCDPLGDGISSIELLPVAPSDLQVVNSARVSMGKQTTKLTEKDTGLINYLAKHKHWTPFSHSQYLLERKMSVADYLVWCSKSADEQFVRAIIEMNFHLPSEGMIHFYERGSLYAFMKHKVLSERMWNSNTLSLMAFKMPGHTVDKHLVNDWTMMLSKPNDPWWNKTELFTGLGWAPEKLQVAQFRIRMPIFVARQWYKHQIGFTRNEVSRRYVSHTPEFFIPHEWRLQASNVKQGSSSELHEYSEDMQGWVADATYGVQAKYNELIEEEKICPEQARSILPQSMYTEFVETASIDAYNRMIGLRTEGHAQVEIQKYAKNIEKMLKKG
tara:strand:- start:125 stop:1180 length:1056 start_codon:yes stop_codon:yes gene_type:complete